MNTKGPNGGKSATSGTKTTGSTVRVTSYQFRPHAVGQPSTKMDRNTSPKVPKQAAVNKGATTQYNAGTQRLARTSVTAPTKYNRNAGQPRASQSTMRGRGTSKG